MLFRLFLVGVLVNVSSTTLLGQSPLSILPRLLKSTLSDLTWEGGPIKFESRDLKRMLLGEQNYIPKNVIGTKITSYLDTIVMLTPKYKKGIPCSLLSYENKLGFVEPEFTPFPSLVEHDLHNCDTIQNAVDFYLDDKNLLWVLDSGVINNMEHPQVVCKPKIVCISMHEKKVVTSYDLSKLVMNETNVQYIVADRDAQGKLFLYVSDPIKSAILVYDVENNLGFRVLLPQNVIKSVCSEDTLYMVLSKPHKGESVLYLSYLNSPYIYSIKTSYLRKGKAKGKISKVGTKVGPMVFLGTNDNEEIYFRYKNEPNVFCWDSNSSFKPEELKPVYTSEDGFLPTAVSLDKFLGKMKVIESNFHDYIANTYGVGVIHQIKDILL